MKKSIFLSHRRFLATLLSTAFMFSLLVGCSKEANPTFRLGTNTWIGYEPLYLARGLGYLDSKAFRLVEYPSSTQTIRAFRNNDIDGVALTLDEVLLLMQDGMDMRVFLVTDISIGGDAVLGRPGITSIKDLAGRRVAVESKALGAYMLTRALELNGLNLEDVEVIHQEANEHVYTFDSDVADAVVGCDPERTELLRKGAVVLFDSSEIPGEIVDVLAVKEDYLEKNPDVIQALLSGWFRAVEHLNDNPEDAADRMGARLHLTREEVLNSLKGLRIPSHAENLELLDGKAATVATSARKLNEIMLVNNLINKRVDVDSLPVSEPLQQLFK